MVLGEIVFYIVISLIIVALIGKFFENSEEEKEYDRVLKESLQTNSFMIQKLELNLH